MSTRYRNVAPPRTTAAQVAQGEHRELLRLLAVVGALVLALFVAADRAAYWLAPRLPFTLEQSLAEQMNLAELETQMSERGRTPPAQRSAIREALQARVARIGQALQLPAEMGLTVHYVDHSMVNAFATLGGHLFVCRGLLEKVGHEETLDAVLAHEIGHIQHRHPVQQLSRGVLTAALLSLVGVQGSSVTRWLLGDVQQLQDLAYSRDAEREADTSAHHASLALHGHTQGAVAVFELFARLQAESGQHTPGWAQSHPASQERADAARAAGGQPQAALTPLAPPLLIQAEPSRRVGAAVPGASAPTAGARGEPGAVAVPDQR